MSAHPSRRRGRSRGGPSSKTSPARSAGATRYEVVVPSRRESEPQPVDLADRLPLVRATSPCRTRWCAARPATCATSAPAPPLGPDPRGLPRGDGRDLRLPDRRFRETTFRHCLRQDRDDRACLRPARARRGGRRGLVPRPRRASAATRRSVASPSAWMCAVRARALWPRAAPGHDLRHAGARRAGRPAHAAGTSSSTRPIPPRCWTDAHELPPRVASSR